MKRILIALFLFFVFSDVSYAQIGSMIQNTGPSGCPPWYADTDVVWSWDGKHPNGADFACDSAANAIQAASGTVEVGTFQGEAGTMKLDSASAGEYYRWSQTADQYICDNCDQIVCIKYYVSAYDDDEDFIMFRTDYDANNYMEIGAWSNGVGNDSAVGKYRAPNGTDTALGSVLVLASWATMAYTWAGDDINAGCSATSNCDAEHSTNPGDQTSPWTGGYEEDPDELDHIMSNDWDDITIGNSGATAPDGSEVYYITQVAIVDTYGHNAYDCTLLTRW